jgi:maltodextrin utilization protein YvdJ
MLYQDQEQPMQITSPKPSTASTAKFWLRQNRLWVAIALVLAISLMVAAS